MRFKTPVAYTKLDKQKEFFSPEALKDICKTTKLPLPVTENFSFSEVPVGKVTNLEFKRDMLIATIELKENIIEEGTLNKYCFRVGGRVLETEEKEAKVSTEIQKIELFQIGMISKINDVYEKEDK